MGDLSEHFSRREFRCKGWSHRDHPPHSTLVAPQLVLSLERLRVIGGGRPLVIVSGFRCAWHNRRVGGAAASQHLRGTAADIPPGYATLSQAREAGFTGVGLRGRWAVHVDVRPSAATWTY